MVLAFSGGIDSAFVLKVAAGVLPRDKFLAVTVVSPISRRGAPEAARAWADRWGVNHTYLELDHLRWLEFVRNDSRRCYYCKRNMYGHLLNLVRERGFRTLVDGTQTDDLQEDRPGLEAIRELGVKTPLLEAGLDKDEILRSFSLMEMSPPYRFSGPCLATRIPTGVPISRTALDMVAEAEERLLPFGFQTLRVRYHGELARIEVLKEDFARLLNLADEIVYEVKRVGFKYVSLDLEGWRRKLKKEE